MTTLMIERAAVSQKALALGARACSLVVVRTIEAYLARAWLT